MSSPPSRLWSALSRSTRSIAIAAGSVRTRPGSARRAHGSELFPLAQTIRMAIPPQKLSAASTLRTSERSGRASSRAWQQLLASTRSLETLWWMSRQGPRPSLSAMPATRRPFRSSMPSSHRLMLQLVSRAASQAPVSAWRGALRRQADAQRIRRGGSVDGRRPSHRLSAFESEPRRRAQRTKQHLLRPRPRTEQRGRECAIERYLPHGRASGLRSRTFGSWNSHGRSVWNDGVPCVGPSSGGCPATGYTVRAGPSPGARTLVSLPVSATTGLQLPRRPARTCVAVSAENAFGASALSNGVADSRALVHDSRSP